VIGILVSDAASYVTGTYVNIDGEKAKLYNTYKMAYFTYAILLFLREIASIDNQYSNIMKKVYRKIRFTFK
jgi:hypothetical protein